MPLLTIGYRLLLGGAGFLLEFPFIYKIAIIKIIISIHLAVGYLEVLCRSNILSRVFN